MNFFFATITRDISSKLSIPKFQNSGILSGNKKLYQADIADDKWVITEPLLLDGLEMFWEPLIRESNKDSIYFISDALGVSKILNSNLLLNVDNFTDNYPEFRSNLMIENKKGGFSSYQSDYPYRMITKLGALYSDCGLLTFENVIRVGVFIRSIYFEPIKKIRELFLFNKVTGQITAKFEIYINETSYIDLTEFRRELKSCYIFAKEFIGIPIFMVEYKDGSLSFEHTHPPHEAIAGKNKFKIVNDIKEKALERISQIHIQQ